MLRTNEQIFEELFRNHYKLLCNYAEKFVADCQIAEDIVQNFFVSIWENQQLSFNPDLFLNYAYRSIKNSCINHYKHLIVKDRFFELLQKEWQEGLSEETDEFMFREEIQAALKKLPIKCKRVFLLKFVSELKYKEIAELLGISVNTVKYHLGEAFRIMKEELGPLHGLFLYFSFFFSN